MDSVMCVVWMLLSGQVRLACRHHGRSHADSTCWDRFLAAARVTSPGGDRLLKTPQKLDCLNQGPYVGRAIVIRMNLLLQLTVP